MSTLKTEQKKQQDILAGLQALDQFARQTSLPRDWHAQWQAIYQQVVGKVQAMTADKSTDNGKPPPG